jgi:hypothetical protein
MSSMNCRNIKREIEARGAGRFSSAVMEHIERCAACETISRQQSELHALVSSLGRVEAPADFDVRLRARLAAEERDKSRSFAFADLSFGLRSAAVAAVLLVIGSTFVFVTFRNRPDAVLAGNKQVAVTPVTPESKPKSIENGEKPVGSDAAQSRTTAEAGSNPLPRPRRNVGWRSELASLRNNRLGTRDQSSTSAGVLKRNDQLAEAYPTAAFPINASYQSLKVSVDNGSGLSRTISLPTVSFGSQRTLSNSASPLMASARGTW